MTTQLNEQAGKLLIAVIEKHKCDAAMAAARKAGAPGGTVLMGRGTAALSQSAFSGWTTWKRNCSTPCCPPRWSAP